MITVPSESFIFCKVRSMKPPSSSSSTGYRSGILPNSLRRPVGHQPPDSIPCISATSRAARSTSVCPPEMIFTASAQLVAGRNNVRTLDHQDHGSFRGARAMAHAFGHNEALPRRKIDNAIFKIDEEMSVENEKEFIDVFMFVPVIFALDNRQPDDRVVHFAKRLVVPFIGAGLDQFLHVDRFKRSVQNVEVCFVREILRRFIGIHDCNLDTEQATGKRISFRPPTASPRLLSFRAKSSNLWISLCIPVNRAMSRLRST